MATVINGRDVALQAASPRTIAVNLGSTINVNGTIGGTAASTVVSNAATGSNHAATTGNPHGVTLSQISGDLDSIANGVTYFRTTANQVTGAGRGYNALNSSNEYIKSLTSTQMTLVGSNPGTGVVHDFNGIRMYQSSTLKVNIPISGKPYFDGDLNVTGTGNFKGSTSDSGSLTTILANILFTEANGIRAYAGSAGGNGVYGNATSSSGAGYGGFFRRQVGSSGAALHAETSTAAPALEVVGAMTINNTTQVSNLNADMVDGYHAAQLCNLVPTNSGTCTVSSNRINLFVVGTLNSTVQTRGTGNNVYLENISDERLKQDIEDEVLGLDFVNSLTPRSFRMRSDPRLRAHGLIYQEVAKLLNDDNEGLASLNPNGIGGVDYNGMISPIIKAIQEISERLKKLEIRSN
jgi:hypothetical protein